MEGDVITFRKFLLMNRRDWISRVTSKDVFEQPVSGQNSWTFCRRGVTVPSDLFDAGKVYEC